MLCIWKVANMFRLTQVRVPPKGDLLPDFDEFFVITWQASESFINQVRPAHTADLQQFA